MKSRLGTLLRLAVSFGLLGVILWHLPLDRLAGALMGADLALVVAALALNVLMHLVNASRMRLIIGHQRLQLSTAEVFGINLRTAFFGLVLPGQIAGGAVRWYLLKRRGGEGAPMLLSIVFDRLNDLTVVAVLGLLFCLAAPPPMAAVPAALALVLLMLLAVRVAVFNDRCIRLSERLFAACGLTRVGLVARAFAKLADSARHFRSMPAGVRVRLWLLSLLSNLVGTATYVLLAAALGLGVGALVLAWVRSTLLLLNLLPISFAGIGVRDGALIVLLGAYGVGAVEAVALSFLLMLRLLVVAGLGGALAACDWFRPALADRSGQPRGVA